VKQYLTCLESAGAGEILLNSVDRDGSRLGYDLKLLQIVSSTTSLPIIALGGVGRFEQLSKAVTEGGCQAVAAANIFQHLEHSTIAAKSQMRRDGLNVRLSSEVKYEDFELDLIGRPF
jgi:cyclase